MNAMAGSLSELSENLSNMQSCALAKRFEKEREVLLDITHDALGMAGMQQSIADASQAPGTTAGQTAALEQDLSNALEHSMEKMNRLAMVSPRALVPIKKAYDNAAAVPARCAAALDRRKPAARCRAAPEADLGAIAQAALNALADLGGQSQSQGGGMGGMMSGLRRLSAQQAMINAATGDLLRSLLSSGGLGEAEGENAREAGGHSEGGAARASARTRKRAPPRKRSPTNSSGWPTDTAKKPARRLTKRQGNSRMRRGDCRTCSTTRRRNCATARTAFSPACSKRRCRSISRTRARRSANPNRQRRFSLPQRPAGGTTRLESGLDAYYRLRQRAFSGQFSGKLPVFREELF